MTGSSDVRILDLRTPEERDRPFLPGMERAWLLPLYDVLTRVRGVRKLHQRAAELAVVTPGQAVLDVGCGTANLSFAVLAAQPDARVTGLDPDRDSLRRAARKARRRRVSLTLVQGYADRLPAEDGSFDRVVSSLALHHLDEDARIGFAREAFRVLRPGGAVTIADFGGPAPGGSVDGDTTHGHGQAHDHGKAHRHGQAHFLRRLPHLVRPHSASNPTGAHNPDDGLVDLLTRAGFADSREVDHVSHRFGRVAFVQATRP